MLSIIFITVSANISIHLFFSDYLKGTRVRDDQKVVQYVEQVYSDNNELNAQSLMSIMHYAFSEAVTVRIRDMQNNIIWNSGTPDTMHSMMKEDTTATDRIAYKNYPFVFDGIQLGTIDVGRPKSIISSIEDKQFLSTINGIFGIAFLFTVTIAVLTSSNIANKFLNPIYKIKENAKLIENGKYKKINEVKTNTYELNDLSISIKELAQRLAQQEELRKRMSTDIAHELRTPIATIQSHIEAFMDGVWHPDLEKLTIVHREITRLTNLIKELSDLTIIESDEIKLNQSTVHLSFLLENVLHSFEPLFKSKSINLYKEVQNDVHLIGDEDRLQRVFVNILTNAYKYTNNNGMVKVSLSNIKGIIRVIIEDSGIGIPKKDLKYIFERFYRSDLSRNRGTGGTGIGLTITKALVEAHDGLIRIESEEDKGTKVIIDFKVKLI